jgi:hypothetical protein
MVYHRVHGTGGNAEEESRATEFAEVAQVVAPIWLRHYCHFVSGGLKCASYDRCTE